MTKQEFDNNMQVYTWFLYTRMINESLVIFVTNDAPKWDVIKDVPWVKQAGVTGMYRMK